MLNLIVLEGRLTKDPEIRTSTTGKNWSRFCLAYNKWDVLSKTNVAQFINAICYDNKASYLGANGRKGSRVIAKGRLEYSTYEKDGIIIPAYTIVCDDVELQYNAVVKQSTAQVAPKPQDIPLVEIGDEDLPF